MNEMSSRRSGNYDDLTDAEISKRRTAIGWRSTHDDRRGPNDSTPCEHAKVALQEDESRVDSVKVPWAALPEISMVTRRASFCVSVSPNRPWRLTDGAAEGGLVAARGGFVLHAK